jgi:hypothetical protein
MTERTDERRRAWLILGHIQRVQTVLSNLGLPVMLIEPALMVAVEKIAIGDPQPDPGPVLDAAAAILDAHIAARQALLADPLANRTVH